MIKKIILMLFFISANAQEKMCVTYKMVRLENEKIENVEKIKANNYLENINFELIFSKELAVFKQNKIVKDGLVERPVFVPFEDVIYIYNNKKYTENSEDVAEKGSFLIEEEFHEWQLHNESKMINNLKCFKATSKYTTNEVNSFDIIAWYCPNLPYSYGPDGIGGLPGVILFLQKGFEVYSAKNIQYNCKEEIVFPNKTKILTYSEYGDYMRKLEEEMFQD